ncbi:MAG: glycosyltransferase [Lachnospiraceae bacterium]|nr:glycosyltransferase [Lachnospiraceae bacterium]
MTKVSVIIPIYNTKEYLEETLNCMLNQTLSEIEIICINDGSTDGSELVVSEYAKHHKNIRLINQDNAGQSAARNAGLEIAVGKYIYCMDSDDLLIATALEEMWHISEREELDVLYFSANTFYENQRLEEDRTDFYDRYLRTGSYPDIVDGKNMLLLLQKNGDYIVSPCLQFIRREYLKENNICFYEGIIHEDNLFGFLVLMNASRTKCINAIYFYRRVHENSVMTRKEGCANLYGYYACFIEQIKAASMLECTMQQQDAVMGVLRGLMYHIRRLYNNIEPEEKEKFIEKCTPLQRYLFEVVIMADLDEIARLKNVRLKNAEDKVHDLEYQFNCMQNSVSYRVGRIITCIPRKIRTCCRVFMRGGVCEVLQIIKEKYLNRS